MKKNLSVLFFGLAVFAIPVFSHAAWWNPSTWFSNQESYVGTAIESEQIETPSPTPIPAPEVIEKVVEKIVENPVEKIVTKTVDNPELIKQIAELEQRYLELEAKYNQLRIDNGILKGKIADFETIPKPKQLSSECLKIKDQIDTITIQVQETKDSAAKKIESYRSGENVNQVDFENYKTTVENEMKKKIVQLESSLNPRSARIGSYVSLGLLAEYKVNCE